MSSVIKTRREAAPADQPADLHGWAAASEAEDFLPFDQFWQEGVAQKPEQDHEAELARRREEVDRQLQAMLAKAREEGARLERDGYEKGYAQGEKDGVAFGRKQYEVEVQRLERLLARIDTDRQELHRRYEADLVTLVKTLVDRLVFHEVAASPRVIAACLDAAQAYVVENAVVRVHLSPEDFAQLQQGGLDASQLLARTQRVDLVEDPAVLAGGCLLETDFGDVDATLESRRDKLFALVDGLLAAGR
ncbi:MAG: FliH/SctL family protein [Thermodesulfobacteriota bacterium]